MRILSGCSYLLPNTYIMEPDELDSKFQTKLNNRFGDHINLAMAGAGNDYIARSIIDMVLRNNVEYAFVLWSGVSRIDIPLGNNVAQAIYDDYIFKKISYSQTWIYSGGYLGSWTSMKRSSISNLFRDCYKEDDPLFYTDRTLTNIITTISVLEANNVQYDMGFMYDPLSPENTEQSLGLLHSSPLMDKINWDKFIPNFPYEYGRHNNGFQKDKFHLLPNIMLDWLDTLKLKIDI